MSEPFVSVIMPALNEEKSIAQAVRSVLDQEGVRVEVLVVNGLSTDRTADVVRDLAREDDRIRLLDNPRSIIPSGLNVGLHEARGTYVARVDCHATVTPDYLRRGAERLDADAGLAAVGGLRRGVSSTPAGRAVALALSSRFGVGNSINHYATAYQETDHASFGVYRADVARAIGGWDESLLVNEDADFDYRIREHGDRIGFDPEMVIDWQVRDSVGGLFRQYRRYGRGKAAMVRKNGSSAVRLRHLAAPVAVVGTGALAVVGVARPIALVGMAPYVAALSCASYAVWRRRPGTQSISVPAIPASFVAMHAGWGLGFLEGLVLGKVPALASGSSATSRPPQPAETGEGAPSATAPGRGAA